MKRLCVIALTLPLTVPAAASSIKSDFIDLMKSESAAIVEATIVSARLHTWRDASGERVCGRSYEVAVNEILWGKAAQRETLSEMFWLPTRSHLRDLDDSPGYAVGGTYVLSISRRATAQGQGSADMANWARRGGMGLDKAASTCLRHMPKDVLRGGTQILKEPERPGESWAGLPGHGREYVRIPSTRAIENSVVFGAFYERFYRRTDKPDTQARAFLSSDGIYPAADAARTGLDGWFLQDDGRNGAEWIFYDSAVSYDDFKRLIRDPDRKPIFGIN